jgi:hypothetical protein
MNKKTLESSKTTQKPSVRFKGSAVLRISGNGVFHVKSSEIVSSPLGVKQLNALKSIRQKILIRNRSQVQND